MLPARAYYLSSAVEPDNLARAETTLQELVSSIENSTDSVNSICPRDALRLLIKICLDSG